MKKPILRSRIVFRVTDDVAAQLAALAVKQGTDPSKLVRSLVTDSLARHHTAA